MGGRCPPQKRKKAAILVPVRKRADPPATVVSAEVQEARLIEKVATVGTPAASDPWCDTLRYWSSQVASPGVVFQGPQWDTQMEVAIADNALYADFVAFVDGGSGTRTIEKVEAELEAKVEDWIEEEEIYDEAVDVPRKAAKKSSTCCTKAEFLNVTRVVLPGFRCTKGATMVPGRALVWAQLQRLPSKTYNATSALTLATSSVKSDYVNPAHQSLTLLVTPMLKRDATNQGDSLISYYNATQSGMVEPTSVIEYARLVDMGTIHPLFRDPAWRALLYNVAGLALVHDLFIYFRFDVTRHHQYVFVHDQTFDVMGVGEDVQATAAAPLDRYSMLIKEDLQEKESMCGRCYVWLCDVEAPDADAEITRLLPSYRGLRVRYMFRQDYSAWFF